jgi:pimeloyl-ACP methyl ester carboxylesterase
MPDPAELSVQTDDGVLLAGEQTGAGPAIVLLHGLTGTRRYVVMGSRVLERSGLRVVAFDARGHGRSAPAPDRSAYGYARLARDLLALLDALEIGRAVLAGVSMGAHTLTRFALDHPARIAGLGLITPAYDPAGGAREPDGFADWDALARGLREGGVEGFVAAYDLAAVPERWRATVLTAMRQRLAAHQHPAAVADALEAVPRLRPFERIDELERISAPTLVIATRDEADPGHPLAVAERYAEALGGARLHVEEASAAPLAWQGGRVAQLLAELAARVTERS